MGWLDFALSVLALIPAAAGLYLAILAIVGMVSGASREPDRLPALSVAVVVPAHNESLNIRNTVASLLAVDYPADKRQLWVLAWCGGGPFSNTALCTCH